MITALQLKQAGFDDEGIIGFIEDQRIGLNAAGFTNHKINKHYGLKVTNKPYVSESMIDGTDGDLVTNAITSAKTDKLKTVQSNVNGDVSLESDSTSLIANDTTTAKEAEANLIKIDEINNADRNNIMQNMEKIRKIIKEEGDVVALQGDWLAKNYPNVTYDEAKAMQTKEFELIEHAKKAKNSPLYRPWKTGVYSVNGKRYNKEEFEDRFPSLLLNDHEEVDTSGQDKIEIINTITTTGVNSRAVLKDMANEFKLKPQEIANINESISFLAEIESGGRSIHNEESTKTGLFQLDGDQTVEAANAFVELNYKSNPEWPVPDWITKLYVHRDMTRLMPDEQRALTLARILSVAGADSQIIKELSKGDPKAIKALYLELHRNDQFEDVDGVRTRINNEDLDARIEEFAKYFDTVLYDYKNPDIAVWATDGWFTEDPLIENLPFGQKLIKWTGGKGHQNVFTNGYRLSLNGSIMAFNSALIDGEDPATVYKKIFMTQEQSFGKQVIQDFTMLMNDVPWYAAVGGACFVAGAATVGTAGFAGAALPIVCGGAAMALPDSIRHSYSEALQNGEVDNLDDFFEQFFDLKTAKVAGISATVGTVTVGTGLAVKRITESTIARLGAETEAMTTVASLMNGQVPTLKDFAHSAILIGGVHTTFKMAGKTKGVYDILHVLYNKYSLHPRDVNKIAEMDSSFREQIQNGEVPKLILETVENLQAKMHEKAGIEKLPVPKFEVNQAVETSYAGMEHGVVVGHKVVGEKMYLDVRDASGNIKSILESEARPMSEVPIKVEVNEAGKLNVNRVIEHPIVEAKNKKEASMDWEVYETNRKPIAEPVKAVTATDGLNPIRIESTGKNNNAISNGLVSVISKHYPLIAKKLAANSKKTPLNYSRESTKTDVLIKANNDKPFRASSKPVEVIGMIKAKGELNLAVDQAVLKIGKDIITVSKDAYEAMRNFENDAGRQSSPKIVGQGDTVLFIHPKTNKIIGSLKGEKAEGTAKEQGQKFYDQEGVYRERNNQSRNDRPWEMPKEKYAENKPVMPESDNPFFALFNAAKGIDMMDLVALVRTHLKNVPAMEGMSARDRGYFRSGGSKDPKIAINKALAKDPEGFIMVMAHEIGHMLDFIAKDGNTMKRGNILASLASMKGFMNKWIDGKNDGAKPFSKKEIDAFKKEAEIEAAKLEPKVDESINKIAEESGAKITPQTIMDIFKTTNARDVINKEFYEAFVSMSGPLKKLVIRDAIKGIMHSDLKTLADKINAKESGAKPESPLSADATKRAEQIFAKNFEKAIKERGLVNKEWVTKELQALSQKWKPFERVEGSTYTKYRDNPRELMADFIMAWLLRPEWVKHNAPKTWEMWGYHISKKPQLVEQWSAIQIELATGGLGRNKAGIESIYNMFKESTEKKLAALDKEIPTLKGKINQNLDQIGYETIDTFTWLYRRLGGDTGNGIRPRWHSNQAKDLNISLENWRYNHALLKRYNDEVIMKVIGPLEKLGYNSSDLGVFMFLRNIAESSQRDGVANPLGVMNIPPALKKHLEGNGDRSAQDMFTAFKEMKPQLETYANEYYAIRQRMIIPVLKDSKLFDKETMDKIENNQEYVTFSVTDYMIQRIEKFGSSGIATASVKKTEGTLGAIDNVLMSTLEKDMRLLGVAKKNKVIVQMVQWMKANKSWMETFNKLKNAKGEIIKEDVIYQAKWNPKTGYETPKGGMKAINYTENGKPKQVHVPENLADAFFHNPLGSMTMVKLLEASALPFKKLFTEYNPAFWGVNMVRDTTRGVRNLEGATYFDIMGLGKKSFVKYMFKAFTPSAKSIFGNGTKLTRFAEENGFLMSMEDGYRGQSGAMARLRSMTPDDYAIEKLIKKHNDAGTFYSVLYNNSFGYLFNALGNMARVAERIPKIAGVMYLRDAVKRGEIEMSVGEQMLRIQKEIGSPSFLRTGRLHAITNNLFLYSNAANQGWRGDLVRAKENPKGVAVKYVAYTVLPKMLQKTMELGGFGVGMAALYTGISEWDKTNYIAIPLGIMMPDGSIASIGDEEAVKEGRVVYFRLPQDESARVINGMFHKGVDAMIKENPTKTGFQQWFEFTSGQGYGLNPAFGFVSDTLTYFAGDAPFDSFKNRSSVDQTVQMAGGDVRDAEIAKWFWNSYGGQSIYKFKGRNELEIASELQEMLNVPIVGRMIGRFIKIGDNVVIPEWRKSVLESKVDKAQTIIDYQDGLNLILDDKSDKLEEKHLIALAVKADLIKKNDQLISQLATSGGMGQFLQEFLMANSEEERILGLKAYIETMQKFDKD